MSRIFKNMKEALNEIERDIMEMGIKVHPHTMQNKVVKDDDSFSTLEVQNYSFAILDLADKDNCVPHLEWCKAEFQERISSLPINPGEAWKLRKDVWEEFLNSKKEFDYTYNQRFQVSNQIKNCIEELKINPDSRQCIIHMHFPNDVEQMRKTDPPIRIPCSMYYQFLIRRDKLDVIYNMRSSDYDTHFAHDIWLADALRKYIAKFVGVEPGLFMMNTGSLHRYKNYTKKHVF